MLELWCIWTYTDKLWLFGKQIESQSILYQLRFSSVNRLSTGTSTDCIGTSTAHIHQPQKCWLHFARACGSYTHARFDPARSYARVGVTNPATRSGHISCARCRVWSGWDNRTSPHIRPAEITWNVVTVAVETNTHCERKKNGRPPMNT